MPRKSKMDRETDAYNARQGFLRELAKVQSYVEAMQLAHGPVRYADAKQCYSNLAYFLGFGHLPDGAREDECRAYVDLWKRIPEAKPGTADKFEEAFATKFPHTRPR